MANLSDFTCQLSRIMCESHTCRSKIVISRIQTNFSRLTDNNECHCLKTDWIEIHCFLTFEKSSEYLRNSLIMLGIGWKSFGNRCRPCFEVVENLSVRLVIVRSRWEIFGNLLKYSFIFGSHRKIFGNSDSVETKNLTHFTEKSWQVYYSSHWPYKWSSCTPMVNHQSKKNSLSGDYP